MKLFFTTMLILLFCLRVSANEIKVNESNETASKVDACSRCHNVVVSLKDRGVDVIIKQTKSIQSENKPHPPAGIQELSDDDIAVIAAILDKS